MKYFITSLDKQEQKTKILSWPFSWQSVQDKMIDSPGIYYINSSWDIGVQGHLFVEIKRATFRGAQRLCLYRAYGYMTMLTMKKAPNLGNVRKCVKVVCKDKNATKIFLNKEVNILRLIFAGNSPGAAWEAEKWPNCHSWIRLR